MGIYPTLYHICSGVNCARNILSKKILRLGRRRGWSFCYHAAQAAVAYTFVRQKTMIV